MESKEKEYSNDDITVSWKPELCIHATTCYKELIEVFNPRKRPWVDMQGAPTQKIIETVKKCPTQALSYRWNDQAKEQPTTFASKDLAENEEITEVKVMKNGPLLIKGHVTIWDPEGKEVKSMKITSLCRCGSSYSMPYCDGTHRKIGFSDTI